MWFSKLVYVDLWICEDCVFFCVVVVKRSFRGHEYRAFVIRNRIQKVTYSSHISSASCSSQNTEALAQRPKHARIVKKAQTFNQRDQAQPTS